MNELFTRGPRRRGAASHHPTVRPRPALPLTLLACVCALLSVVVVVSGCAALPPARMVLPPALAQATPQVIEGLHGGERGEFRLGTRHGRFERGASSLSLFDRLVQDRGSLRYTLEPEGARAECRLRASTATLGVLQFPLKRATLACEIRPAGEGAAQQLALQAVDTAVGTRDERRGRFDAGALTLALQSVHHVQGSALPLAAPVGYLISLEGEPVAALDLTDSLHPRLWQRSGDAPDTPLARAVAQVALALALVWDPAVL
ncbi:MAG: hypothetical protein HY855_16890 [Burkholderiales bacterium]|nr:hypothetical protein [Burkholderiales bacterium]